MNEQEKKQHRQKIASKLIAFLHMNGIEEIVAVISTDSEQTIVLHTSTDGGVTPAFVTLKNHMESVMKAVAKDLKIEYFHEDLKSKNQN